MDLRLLRKAISRSGMGGLLIYRSDFRCRHWTAIIGDRWQDGVRLSDIEGRFTCQACGRALTFGRISIGRNQPDARPEADTTGKVDRLA